MKAIIVLSVLLPVAALGAVREVSLDEVVHKVRAANHAVYQDAQKVYQAKAHIERARADLLPKLNVWKLVPALFDPMALLDVITDLAPFLVPGNWFRLEENKILYKAEREGFRALVANEIHTAKSLYLRVLFDAKLLAHVQRSREDLAIVLEIVKTRETFGGVAPGTSRDLEIRMLGLREDERNLRSLIEAETNALSFALGMKAPVTLKLLPVADLNVADLSPLSYEAYADRMIDASPERKQYSRLLEVLPYLKQELEWSILGASTTSRGVAGGIFDAIPIPDGLGFGNGATMKLIKAQGNILRSQRAGVEETLKRQLQQAVRDYNLDLEYSDDFNARMRLAREARQSMLDRLNLGEEFNVLELIELSKSLIAAEASIYGTQLRLATTRDKIDRLILARDYADGGGASAPAPKRTAKKK